MTNFTMDTRSSSLQPVTLAISGAQTLGKGLGGRSRHLRSSMGTAVEDRQCKQTTGAFSRAGSYTDVALYLRASSQIQSVGLRSCHH